MIKGILYLFAAVLLGMFSWKLGGYSIDLYQKGKASENWIAVEARIEKFAYPQRRQGRNKVSNPHVDVVYHYDYQGVSYRGDTLGFGPYSKGQLERPSRGKATVYVNPSKPAESVYVKGVSKPNLGALAVALGLGVFGGFMAFNGIRSLLKEL